MLREDCVPGRSQFRKPRADFSVARLAGAQAGISNRNARIAHQAAPLRALHRASAKHVAEFLFGERDQPFQVRRKKRVLFTLAGLEIRQRRHRRAAIPRANVLADVAAEDVPADGLAQFERNRAAQLDRQIGNAAPRVQNVRLDDGARRACVDAQAAVSAQIRRRRFRGVQRRREIERRHDHAEEQPRTQLFIDEAGVLREPAEPRIFRGDAFDDRAGIHIGSRLEGFREFTAQMFDQRFEFFAEHMVIVVAPGIAGDPAARTCVAGWMARAPRSKREAPCCS